MTRSGPQRYPGASTAYWYQDNYPGSAMEVNCCALHTTEGLNVPSYRGGRDAPNFTILPLISQKKAKWYQHYDFDTSSRALMNLSGGVETNTANAVQVEFVGTCDDSHRNSWRLGSRTYRAGVDYIYWPDAPDWLLKEVAKFLQWANKNHGLKLSGPEMWLHYGKDSRRPGVTPASYGDSPARMSFSEWRKFYGICGHQHVPENDHGDPGALDFKKLISFAKGEEEEVTRDDIEAIAKAVYEMMANKDGVYRAPRDAADYEKNKHWTFRSHTQATTEAARQTRTLVEAQGKLLEKIIDKVEIGSDAEALKQEIRDMVTSLKFQFAVPEEEADQT